MFGGHTTILNTTDDDLSLFIPTSRRPALHVHSARQAPAMISELPISLLHLLSTTLVLDHVVAYLPLPSLFALSATCRIFKSLILGTPGVFRYLDLSRCQGAQIANTEPLDPGGNVWRSERMDEALTEDEFYSGPLRGIFSSLERKGLLRHVHVLVLDRLSVTVELVNDIITSERFSVRLLSVVGCRNLNERRLMQLLKYVCRTGRPEGTPRLKGIYVFPKRELQRAKYYGHKSRGVLSAVGAQLGGASGDFLQKVPNDEAWWLGCGQVLNVPKSLREDWELTMYACQGIISFDGVLCSNSQHFMLDPIDASQKGMHLERLHQPIATISLSPSGCASCGRTSNGTLDPIHWGDAPLTAFPLMSPLPRAGRIDLAAAPPSNTSQYPEPELTISCEQCLQGRWCTECNRYWCRDCYDDSYNDFYESAQQHQPSLSELANAHGGVAGGDGVLTAQQARKRTIKVSNGLCIEHCLVPAEMDGAGAGGMWG